MLCTVYTPKIWLKLLINSLLHTHTHKQKNNPEPGHWLWVSLISFYFFLVGSTFSSSANRTIVVRVPSLTKYKWLCWYFLTFCPFFNVNTALLDHRNGVNLVKQMRLISFIRLYCFITVIFSTVAIPLRLMENWSWMPWPLHATHQTTKQTYFILFHFGESHWRIGKGIFHFYCSIIYYCNVPQGIPNDENGTQQQSTKQIEHVGCCTQFQLVTAIIKTLVSILNTEYRLRVFFLMCISIEHRKETDTSFELIRMFAVCKTPINGKSNIVCFKYIIIIIICVAPWTLNTNWDVRFCKLHTKDLSINCCHWKSCCHKTHVNWVCLSSLNRWCQSNATLLCFKYNIHIHLSVKQVKWLHPREVFRFFNFTLFRITFSFGLIPNRIHFLFGFSLFFFIFLASLANGNPCSSKNILRIVVLVSLVIRLSTKRSKDLKIPDGIESKRTLYNVHVQWSKVFFPLCKCIHIDVIDLGEGRR